MLIPNAEPRAEELDARVWATPSPADIKVLEKLIVSLTLRISLSKNSGPICLRPTLMAISSSVLLLWNLFVI